MKGLSQEQLIDLITSVGTHRKKRKLSPYECGELFDKAQRMGHSLKECAEAVGISDTGTISDFIRLMKIGSSYSYLVDWGRTGSTVAFKTAATLAKLNESDQAVAFEAAIDKRLKKTEAEQIVQIRQRSGRKIGECIQEVVGMRPRITTVNVIIGAIESESLMAKLSALSQVARDQIMKRVVDSRFPNLQKYSARLGKNKFTITADDDDSDYLRSRAGNLEDIIEEGLISLL